MEMSQIKMYELFKNKFGHTEAEAFVHLIEEKMDTKIDQRKHELATKDDIYRLREEMSAMKIELKGDMSAMKIELKDGIEKLRSKLSRTIYLTSLGQLFAIVASVVSLTLLLLKK